MIHEGSVVDEAQRSTEAATLCRMSFASSLVNLRHAVSPAHTDYFCVYPRNMKTPILVMAVIMKPYVPPCSEKGLPGPGPARERSVGENNANLKFRWLLRQGNW